MYLSLYHDARQLKQVIIHHECVIGDEGMMLRSVQNSALAIQGPD
jgi:hypothetical protein